MRRLRADLDGLERQQRLVRDIVERDVRTAIRQSAPRSRSFASRRSRRRTRGRTSTSSRTSTRQGIVNVVDLLDAQNQSLVASQAAAASVYDHLLDLYELQRAIAWFADDQDRRGAGHVRARDPRSGRRTVGRPGRNEMNARTWSRPVAAALLASLAGCGGEEPVFEEPVRPVKTLVVGGSVAGTFAFPAIIEAGEKALLTFRVSGRLESLPIDEGQEIDRGQLIAKLEPRDFQIAVEESRAEFTKAEADYARYQRLFESDAVPLADLELRRSQRDVAKARLEEAERNLSYTELRAPFAGRIGRRYVENHMDVTANQSIADLNDIRNVELVIDVAENLMKQLRNEGDYEVWASFDGAPGQQFSLAFQGGVEPGGSADPDLRDHVPHAAARGARAAAGNDRDGDRGLRSRPNRHGRRRRADLAPGDRRARRRRRLALPVDPGARDDDRAQTARHRRAAAGLRERRRAAGTRERRVGRGRGRHQAARRSSGHRVGPGVSRRR